MQAIADRPVDVLRAQGEGIGPGTRAGPGNLQPVQIARLACQLVQDTRMILTRVAMKAAWSALRELPDAQPWAA